MLDNNIWDVIEAYWILIHLIGWSRILLNHFKLNWIHSVLKSLIIGKTKHKIRLGLSKSSRLSRSLYIPLFGILIDIMFNRNTVLFRKTKMNFSCIYYTNNIKTPTTAGVVVADGLQNLILGWACSAIAMCLSTTRDTFISFQSDFTICFKWKHSSFSNKWKIYK